MHCLKNISIRPSIIYVLSSIVLLNCLYINILTTVDNDDVLFFTFLLFLLLKFAIAVLDQYSKESTVHLRCSDFRSRGCCAICHCSDLYGLLHDCWSQAWTGKQFKKMLFLYCDLGQVSTYRITSTDLHTCKDVLKNALSIFEELLPIIPQFVLGSTTLTLYFNERKSERDQCVLVHIQTASNNVL